MKDNNKIREQLIKDANALKESEARYRELVETAGVAILIDDEEGNVKYSNNKFAELFGYSENEIKKLKIQSIVHPDDLRRVMKFHNERLQKRDVPSRYEFKGIKKDGFLIYLEVVTVPLLENGNVVGTRSYLWDITGRRRMEETLRKNQKQLLESQRIAHMGSWQWNFERDTTIWSDELYSIFGVEANQFDPNSFEEFLNCVHPEDRERVAGVISKSLNEKTAFEVEYRIICPNKTVRHIRSMGEVTFNKIGEVITMQGSSQDITKQKRAEDRLKDEHAFRSSVIKNATEGLCVCHNIEEYPYVKFTEWNDRMTEITGYTIDEINQKGWYQTMYPDPEVQKRAMERMDRMRQGENISNEEWTITRADGQKRALNMSTSIVISKEGEVHVLALMNDITDRKKVDEQLQLHSNIMTNLSEGINLVRVSDGTLIYTNPQFENMFGYGPGELIGKHVSVLNPPIENNAKDQVQEILNGLDRENRWNGEIETIKKDGTIFFCYASIIKSTHHEFGDVFISAQIDITENKLAEDKLKVSEEKYRSLVESTDDIVYLIDKKCLYIFMNKKHADRFNLPIEKIIGRTYSEFHSKKQTELFKKDVNKVIRTGNPLSHEHESERDGKFYLRTFSPVKNRKGEVIAVNVISKDISGLKQVENQLKQSEQEVHKFAEYLQIVREKERALVAGELHDEVGQALTGLKMDIFMIKNKMSKDKKEIPSQFQRMEKLLDDSIQKLRKIYSDLRPRLLEHFGIGEAIGQYVSDFQEQSGTTYTFYQNPEEIILDEDRSIALYRIFQGAINNIKWHSQATKVNIRLVEKGPNLKLTVRDNGKGIKEEQINSGESFGLIGMRERARYLGGNIEIKGLPNKGTTLKLEIPIKQKNP